MDYRLLTVSFGLFVVVLPCSTGNKVSRVHEMSGDEGQITQHEKRSFLNSLSESNENAVDDDEGFILPLPEDDLEKRGSLFRFGKRQGSLFRFGKRQGSLFRFGKRQDNLLNSEKRGSLFRFGKRHGNLFRFGKRNENLLKFDTRGGSLFRFGRSGHVDFPVQNFEKDKRTLFRFGKRSDLEMIRDSLAQYRNLKSSSDVDEFRNKRSTNNFLLEKRLRAQLI